MNVTKPQAHGHVLQDGIFGRPFRDDVGRPIEMARYGKDRRDQFNKLELDIADKLAQSA